MQAVTYIHYGHRHMHNSATPMVVEYLERKALAGMGYTSPLASERTFVLECFLAIESELNRLRAYDAEVKARQHGKF